MPSQYRADMPSLPFRPPPQQAAPDPAPASANKAVQGEAPVQALVVEDKTPAAQSPSALIQAAQQVASESRVASRSQPGAAPMSPSSDARHVRIVLNQLATFAPMLSALVRTGAEDESSALAEMMVAHKQVATEVVSGLGLSDHPATLAQIGRGVASVVSSQWGKEGFSADAIASQVVALVQASSGYDVDRVEYSSAELDELMGRCRTVTTLSTAAESFAAMPDGVRAAVVPPAGESRALIAALAEHVTGTAVTMNDAMLSRLDKGNESIGDQDRLNSLKAWRHHMSQLVADSLVVETQGVVDRLIDMTQPERVSAVNDAGEHGLLFDAVTAKARSGIEHIEGLVLGEQLKPAAGPRPR